MDLSNYTYDQLVSSIMEQETSAESQLYSMNRFNAKSGLNVIYPCLEFKKYFDRILNIKFRDIIVNEMILHAVPTILPVIDNHSTLFSMDLPTKINEEIKIVYLHFNLNFGDHNLDILYERASGLITNINYYNDKIIVVKGLHFPTSIKIFNSTEDGEFNIDFLEEIVDEVNKNKVLYNKTFTPLLKALYTKHKNIQFPTENDVKTNYDAIGTFINESDTLNVPWGLDKNNISFLYKSTLSPYSYLKLKNFVAYFNDSYNISHLGIIKDDNLYMVSIESEHMLVKELETIAEKYYGITDIVSKFSDELQLLTEFFD